MSRSAGLIVDGLIFLAVLLPIVTSDITRHRIPDRYIASGVLLILLRRLLFSHPLSVGLLLDAVTGFSIGFTFIFLIWIVTRKKIGLGDAKLSGLMGLLLGLPGWVLALLLASVSGAAYGISGILRGTMTRRDRIPFAPFLGIGALAGWTFNLLGEEVIHGLI